MTGSIIITGATGNVGSALAAEMLLRDQAVVCLSRNDDDGQRTRGVIAQALRDRGADAERADAAIVLPIDPERLDEESAGRVLASGRVVWHCAAEMSYAPARLAGSFAFNVVATSALYHKLVERCPALERFFYLSTSYVSGPTSVPAPEQLHTTCQLHNPYLVTKWGAEMALAHLRRALGGAPVTIFRTPIIVGHSQTGRYSGKMLAVHAFWNAFRIAARMGARRVELDLDPEVRHHYLATDDLVRNASALTLDTRDDEPLRVAHCASTQLRNREVFAWTEEVLDLRVDYGKPQTEVDHVVAGLTAPQRKFNVPGAGQHYCLATDVLPAVLGSRFVRHPVRPPVLARWLCDNTPVVEPESRWGSAGGPTRVKSS